MRDGREPDVEGVHEEIDGSAVGTATLDAAQRAGRLLVAEAMVIEREVADELCDAAIGQSGAGELFELSVPVGCYDPALQIRALGSYA